MIEINWSPFATNPLDYVQGHVHGDCKLVTPDGQTVAITMEGSRFIVTIGDSRSETSGNLNTCYFLNAYQVGRDE
jgi:hypothetical protein